MSEGALEPTRVIPPSRGGGPTLSPGEGNYSEQNFYDTYNTRYVQPEPGESGPDYSDSARAEREAIAEERSGRGSGIRRLYARTPGSSVPVNVPKPLPRFLGSRPVIFFAWAVAMIMVSLDEWHTYGMLPRPARLWYTSLTYMLLAAVSIIDVTVPFVNLIAVGFTIAVAYQYYTGAGAFGGFGAKEASTTGFAASAGQATQANG